jgi:hypothetical protein
MKLSDFLDRYIQGEPHNYFFQIEIMWGRNIDGGQFHYKVDARKALLSKLITFLDDPELFLNPKKK